MGKLSGVFLVMLYFYRERWGFYFFQGGIALPLLDFRHSFNL